MSKILVNKGNNLVSIIMPAHNASKYISESIESVIKQTYRDWQLIIVNDRSTDDTESIITSFMKSDKRIYLINNTSSQGGAYYARNLALDIAKGRYIAFLDSDDLWREEKLAKQIHAMNAGGFFASHCSYIRIRDTGEHLNTVKVRELVTYNDQLKSNRIPNLTGIYDREKVDIVKQSNIGHEDYHMWLKILSVCPSIGLDEPLAYYRVLSESLSSNKIQAAAWHYKILRQQQGVSFIRRVFYFSTYIYNAIYKRV
jgi:glycosyltransferase involved in cell wall biosynthesis